MVNSKDGDVDHEVLPDVNPLYGDVMTCLPVHSAVNMYTYTSQNTELLRYKGKYYILNYLGGSHIEKSKMSSHSNVEPVNGYSHENYHDLEEVI